MFSGGKLMKLMDLDWSFTALLPVVFLHLQGRVQIFQNTLAGLGSVLDTVSETPETTMDGSSQNPQASISTKQTLIF